MVDPAYLRQLEMLRCARFCTIQPRQVRLPNYTRVRIASRQPIDQPVLGSTLYAILIYIIDPGTLLQTQPVLFQSYCAIRQFR